MKPVELMARLREAGVDLRADGDKLRFTAPPGALTPELREALAAGKQEVLEILRRPAGTAGRTSRAIEPVSRTGPLPLSFPQRRMWFFEQVHPGTATYHMCASWRIRGALDASALRRCFEAVVLRHESLRTGFGLDGEDPVQTVADRADVPLPVFDLTDLTGAEQAAEADRVLAVDLERPFDLARPPLLRTTMVRTGDEEHLLQLTIHHAVADMWSLDLLLKEVSALYPGGDGDRLPVLPVQYADFAAWQRSVGSDGELAEQVEYWTRYLAGAPTLLELATDRPRPKQAGYAGAQEAVEFPADLLARVDDLARREGATRFMVMLAAFHVLLARYTGEPDTLVGVPIANRTRVETENLIGFFANTLVLRADLADDPSVTELVGRVRDGALDAYEHQDCPVEKLVEELHPRRDAARSPLFQAMFVMQNTSMSPLVLAGLDVEPLPSARTATEFDLTLEFTDPGTGARQATPPGEPAGPTAAVLYNAEVFDGGAMRRLLGHWQTLLEAFVADPGCPVSRLALLRSDEADMVLRDWNATGADHEHIAVHERILRQARLTPDAVAVAYRDRTLSYAGLADASAALARRLLDAGLSADRPVAVCVQRSPEMIIGLLGVLRSGAGYLPLDAGLPPDRLAFILEDAAVDLVVTTKAQRHLFAGRPVRLLLVDDDGEGGTPELPEAAEDALAYVIYTSGSTGRPKGVLIEHRALTNFLAAMDGVLAGSTTRPGVWLAVTSVSFDIAALELFWPLCNGWKVVVQEADQVLPGAPVRPARTARRLDFSLFYFAVSSESDDPGERYRLLQNGARFADQNGFSAVWTPERHFDPFGGLYPNPAVTSAALAMITERVELRAGSVVLPLHNPIRVAEEWAVVDNLSGGRVGLSFASGWHVDDFAVAADPGVFEQRRELMVEAIETVRRLWRGQSVPAVNGAGREIQVRTFPQPVRPEPPIWLAAAGSPETFRLAGELGAGLLTHLLGQSLDELEQKVAVYRRAWKDAGHEGEGQVTLMAHTYVGDDPEQVRETVRGPFREYLRRSFGLVRSLAPSLGIDGEPTAEDVEALLDYAFENYYDGGGLMGTFEECAAMAERIRDAGVDEVACLIDFGVPADTMLASLPLLDQVRQRFATAVPAGPAADGPDGPDGSDADYGVGAQIRRHGVTHVQFTPSLAGVLLADAATGAALGEVDTLLVGGEALTATLAGTLAATARRGVINMYGPTETTIWSTAWPVRDPEEGVSVGRPIANTSVYVLDANRRPVPVGVPGELWIGGMGVARGYLGRPELTAERFDDSPFAAGERMYRTGDRVRHRPDGTLEFLGRVDRQVKLGGHRIELGEIESALVRTPGVRQAAVVLRQDGGGFGSLAAYLVADADADADADRPTAAAVREHLLRDLPEVMVPALFVWLDELPLNTSGKVDYRALPDPAEAGAHRTDRSGAVHGGGAAPRDEVERVIAGIWQDVLGVPEVGVHDDFFQLGGHSLMAIQMVSRLRSAVDKEVSLRVVFEASTVAELAERIRGSAVALVPALPPLVPAPRTGPVPLSFAQQRMWFFELMNPGTGALHLAGTLRLRGRLRPDALRRAFEEIVRRHEILRTNYIEQDGVPVQFVVPACDVPLPVVDFAGRDEAALLDAAGEEARRPFDLATDLLLRTTLLRLAEDEHVLLLTTHHIAVDTWSVAIMATELGVIYDAYRNGKPSPLPDLPVQYADYTVWQHGWLAGDILDRQLEFWRETLADAPPVLALPHDRPRPEVFAHRGEQVVFKLPPELSAAVEAASDQAGVTVFVTLLSAFAALLHRWSGEERIVLGVPVGGRSVVELEPMIGFFANITAMNIDLTGRPGFTELLHRVRGRVLGAYDHQDLPVEKLVAELGVERDPAYNPLFQVMFGYTNDLALAPVFGDLQVSPVEEAHPGHVFMDLNVAMEKGPDGLEGTLDYSTELFDGTTIDWLLRSFQELLAAVVAQPELPVGELPLADGRPVPAARPEPVRLVIASTFTANPVQDSLDYWSGQLDLPLDVRFAPYDQVFQQLLTPGSTMAGNPHGVNTLILRPDDWGPDHAQREQVGREFVSALKAFRSAAPSRIVVVMCPAAVEDARTEAWQRALLAEVSEAGDVIGLDMTEMLDLYGVGDYHDPISEEAGAIPYTAEFFAVLGTCLARQTSALVAAGPATAVVFDDDWLDAADEGVRALRTEVGAAWTARGRKVLSLRTGGLPLAEALDKALAGAGLAPADCLFLSGEEAACAEVRHARPDIPALAVPSDPDELAAFFEHTWELDTPGGRIPGPSWWEGEH